MRTRKKSTKILALLLMTVMLFTSIPFPTYATEVGTAEVESNNEYADEFYEEVDVEILSGETSAITLSLFGVDNTEVPLKDTNEVAWIDRIIIPNEVRAFYNQLVEGSDDDGENDILIEDTYFDYENGNGEITFTVLGEEVETFVEEDLRLFGAYVYNATAAAFFAFDRDHPEVFWLDGGCAMGYGIGAKPTDNGTYQYYVNMVFVLDSSDYDIRESKYQSQSAIESAIATRDADIDTILDAASGRSNYEKIRYFNDVLTTTNEYNTSADLNNIVHEARECIGALAGNTGTTGPVCEAYARAFKVLCDREGIPCVLVDGQAKTSPSDTGGGHMWNYVQLDGVWYAVDVTWNDPMVYGITGAVSGRESENWLLVGSDTLISGMTFIESHPVENSPSSAAPNYTNGPVISETKYVPTATTTLSEVATYKDTNQQSTFTYGDTITVKAKAVAGTVVATTQTMGLYYGDTKLAESSEADAYGVYTLTYNTADKKVPGTTAQTLTLRFDGGSGTNGNMSAAETTVSVTIQPVSRTVALVDDSLHATYTGQTPAVKVMVDGALYEGSVAYEYKAAGSDAYKEGLPVNAGTYTVRATVPASSDGFYASATSAEKTLVIDTKEISITALPYELEYGETLPQDASMVSVSPALAEGDAVTAIVLTPSTSNVTTTGTITPSNAVIKNGNEDRTANYDITYQTGALTITASVIKDADVTISVPTQGYTYDGTEKKPTVEVRYNNQTLIADTDYSVAYSNNINAGTATVAVTGKGNFAGTVTKTYEIQKLTLTPDVSVVSKTYDGTTDATLSINVDPDNKIVAGDSVVVTGAKGTYTSKNVGSEIVVAIEMGTVTGTNSGNYDVKMPSSVKGNITRRPVTVSADAKSKIYGETDPALTYSIAAGTPLVSGESLAGALSRENGENRGTYAIVQNTLTNANNPNYNITFTEATFTINPATYTAEISSELTVLVGNVVFTEPVFKGVNGETVAGTLTYGIAGSTGLSYSEVVAHLETLAAGESCQVTYSFVPTVNGNYEGNKEGTITFNVRTIEFYVGNTTASISNAVEVKANPVYGDSWSDIVKINSDLYAIVVSEKDETDAHFSLNVTGTPVAGAQAFSVIYSGKIAGETYSDVVVCSGTVNVAKKTVNVSAGTYKISKVYDGTVNAGTASGELVVDGILAKDTSVQVVPAIGNYTNANAGVQTSMTVALSLNGNGKENYQLSATEVTVPCEIVKKSVTPVIAVTGTYTYTGSAIVPTYTVQVSGETLAATNYNVDITNNVNAGTATISITEKVNGNYTWNGAITKTFEINKIVLVPTITVAPKVYDGTTNATLSITVDPEHKIVSGDTVEITGTTGTYVSKNVGTGITVVIEAGTIRGTNSGNYDVQMPVSVTSDITRRAVSVSADAKSKNYGDTDPVLTYTVSDSTPLVKGETLTGVLSREAGNDRGTYAIVQNTLTNANNPNYDITFTPAVLTINPVSYSVEVENEITVWKDNVEFIAPAFVGVNNEVVSGSLTYSYKGTSGMDYDDVVACLESLSVGENAEISYVFVPVENGNYIGNKEGVITFTVRDVDFFVGNEKATITNAVTIKESPVYGDSWSDIVQISSELVARRGTESDDANAHFTLNVTGSPVAGEYEFAVVYNGEVDGKTFTNVTVCTGTVTVAKRTVIVAPGTYKVSKVYDKTVSAGAGTGELVVDGILAKDTSVKVDIQINEYDNANAGVQNSIVIALSLSGTGNENYKLSVNELTVPCEILKKAVTPEVLVTGTYTYTGSAIIPTYAVQADGDTLKATDYEATLTNNTNAGTATISVVAKESGNYTWNGAVTKTFTIEKATFTGKKAVDMTVRRGNDGALDLTELLPEGAKLGAINVADSSNILDETAVLNGNILSFSIVDADSVIDKVAVITIPVTETTNYVAFDLTVTITAIDKLIQENFGFAEASLDKTYGDEAFVFAATGQVSGSSVTYVSSNPEVATVDETGKVTILAAGSVEITAIASATNDYHVAKDSYTLTIAKLALTWDTTELYAVDREDEIANQKATLYGVLGVNGILESDASVVTFNCPADKLTGIYKAVTAGEQIVELAWADSANPVVLEGEKASNYLLPESLPQVAGTINEVNESELEPEGDKQYKIVIEGGISSVPEQFKNKDNLDSPQKIEDEMRKQIQEIASGILSTDIDVYDVELQIKVEGQGWVKVTKDTFPSEGVTVVLPYPEGTGKDTHNFKVAHLFTEDVNGYHAGDVECPTVTKTDKGIAFKVHGLSPISVGWTKIPQTPQTPTDWPSEPSEPEAPVSPKTGDNMVNLLWVCAFIAVEVMFVKTLRRKNMWNK